MLEVTRLRSEIFNFPRGRGKKATGLHGFMAIFVGNAINQCKMNKIFIFSGLLACASIMGLTACHNHGEGEGHDHDHEELAEASGEKKESHGSDEIVLSPEKAKAAGVTVAKVVPGDFNGVIKTSGKIMPASGDESTLVARTAGVVSLSRPITEGMPVAKGAVMFTVSSAGIQDGDVTQRARIALNTAKDKYERAKSLLDDRMITQTEFDNLKAEYETARVAFDALGKPSGSGVAVSSPISGYVMSCLVKQGDFVQVGQPLMTVTQNRRLFLRADVAERDYGSLGAIRSAKFRMAGNDKVYDIAALQGRLVSCGKSSEDNSFFIPVTFEFDNSEGVVPGTFAEIYLITGTRPNVISVPVSALTEEQGVYYVYLRLDEDCYRKQEVKTGATDGEYTEITEGLKGGEQLVTKGAMHVKLASAGKSIPGHTHNH